VHLVRCRGFWLWALAGFFVTFSLVSAASIGLFVLPVAAASVWAASRWSRPWPEGLGLGVGAAAVCFLIAWIQREPGGLDPTSWLLAGTVLALVGIVGYALLTRRISHPA
jgi:hypothetical protein